MLQYNTYKNLYNNFLSKTFNIYEQISFNEYLVIIILVLIILITINLNLLDNTLKKINLNNVKNDVEDLALEQQKKFEEICEKLNVLTDKLNLNHVKKQINDIIKEHKEQLINVASNFNIENTQNEINEVFKKFNTKLKKVLGDKYNEEIFEPLNMHKETFNNMLNDIEQNKLDSDEIISIIKDLTTTYKDSLEFLQELNFQSSLESTAFLGILTTIISLSLKIKQMVDNKNSTNNFFIDYLINKYQLKSKKKNDLENFNKNIVEIIMNEFNLLKKLFNISNLDEFSKSTISTEDKINLNHIIDYITKDPKFKSFIQNTEINKNSIKRKTINALVKEILKK